jgi:hypothetical protein
MTGPIVVHLQAADGATSTITIPQPVVTGGRPTGPGFTPIEGMPGRLTARTGNMGATVATLPAGTFGDPDFTDLAGIWPVFMWYLATGGATGFAGNGIDSTVLAMPANTATLVNPTGGTNDYSLVCLRGSQTIQDCTILATAQGGRLFNGLRFEQTTAAKASRVKIKGIPGNASIPPGETFSLNNQRSTGLQVTDVEIDGTNTAGVPVAATGCGNNTSQNFTYTRLNVHDMRFGHGSAHYLCGGAITYRSFTGSNIAWGALNFEQCDPGTVITIDNPRFSGNAVDVILDSTRGLVTCNITNLAPGQLVRVCCDPVYSYNVAPNTPTIRPVIKATNTAGQDVTAAQVQILTSYTPH